MKTPYIVSFRLNPDNPKDREIIDFLEKSYLSKSSTIKLALVNEMNGAESKQEPSIPLQKITEEQADKKEIEPLISGFKAFSDNDI